MSLRQGWLIVLLLLGLVLLTFRMIALAYLWLKGWYMQPTIVGDLQLSVAGSAALFFFGALSVGVDWYLMTGWIRRGRDWLAARTLWIKWLGLWAPVISLWISLRSVALTLHRYGEIANPPLGAGQWEVEFLSAGLQLLYASLLAVLVVIAARAALRRR